MAPLLEDPRIRQTWNNISHNAETATESAATTLWTFTHDYINPCLASVSASLESCTSSCFPDNDERARRLRERGRTRGRAEYSFDFYDDWEDEEENNGSGGLLGWGNDELDRLLAGSGSRGKGGGIQPSGRKRGMSYGTGKVDGPRRKHTIDGLPVDPTIIPSTNTLGFLQRLPWKLGGTLRYKPSAADMKDHPGQRHDDVGVAEEGEPLIDDEDRSDNDEDGDPVFGHRRKRSGTTGSGDTSDSFRSRGDLFPSDGEDDAVPLDDEFAMVLERRGTGLSMDGSSGKTKLSKGKRVSSSRQLSRTVSRTTQSSESRPPIHARSRSTSAGQGITSPPSNEVEVSSLTDLQHEEERLQRIEDQEIQSKREAATRLAAERGLSISQAVASEIKEETDSDIENIEFSKAATMHASKDSAVVEELARSKSIESPEQQFVGAKLPRF